MKASSRRWLLLAVATVVVAAGAVAVWLWDPTRPRHGAPPAVASDDIGWEEARAKKLPEYAELRTPIDRGKPLPDEQVTRALELAGHPNAMIRISALGRLTRVTEPRRAEAIDRFAQSLRDPNRHVRFAAMQFLGQAEAPDRIPDLLPFLDSTDSDERTCAQRALSGSVTRSGTEAVRPAVRGTVR